MEFKEPIHIDGNSYSRAELAEYCRLGQKDHSFPGWKKEVLLFIKQLLDPAHKEIEQKTSGTTGDPGKHLLNKKAMFQSARRTLEYFQLQSGDRALLCLPIKYVAGKMMAVRALVGGLNLILVEPSSRPLKELSDPINFGAMVPLQVHESIQYGDNLSLLSTLLIGGGELNISTRKELCGLTSLTVYESFGMTETYTHFALKRINGPHPEKEFKLLEGVRIDLDQRDCLVVNFPGVTEGSITTNDLVEINSSGTGFRWLGRYDHVINSGGIKIIPELLEQQITKCLGLECLLLSEPDPKLGEKLVLVVACPEPDPPVNSWMDTLGKHLKVYEIPRRIVITRGIPRNPSFKPDRQAARELL